MGRTSRERGVERLGEAVSKENAGFRTPAAKRVGRDGSGRGMDDTVLIAEGHAPAALSQEAEAVGPYAAPSRAASTQLLHAADRQRFNLVHRPRHAAVPRRSACSGTLLRPRGRMRGKRPVSRV